MSGPPTPAKTRFGSKNHRPHQQSPAIINKEDKSSNKFEMCLTKQLEDYTKELKSLIQDNHHILIEKLDKIVTDFNTRFDDVNRSMSALTIRIEVLEQTSESIRCSQLDNEISVLQGKIDSMERDKLSADVILHGAPPTANEDLRKMFDTLCTSIDCVPPIVPKDIFRTKSKGAAAIVIKFTSAADKFTLLRSTNQAYKKTRKPLCLQNIGLQSDRPIYINESLTARNLELYRKAFQLKHQKRLFSVFTRTGRVYVRQTPNAKAFLIDSIQHLDTFAAVTANHDDITPAHTEEDKQCF